jgi:signal transduction histidine kinase
VDKEVTTLIDQLLQPSRSAGLVLDRDLNVVALHQLPLLREWSDEAICADVPVELGLLLAPLLPLAGVQRLRESIASLPADAIHPEFEVLPLRAVQSGVAPLHLAFSVLPLAGETGAQRLLLMRDVSAFAELRQSHIRAQESFDTAMALLRAAPDAVRLFLGSAMATVSVIRATLRMPARTQEAVQDKLTRLHASALQLGNEARMVGLDTAVRACQGLCEQLALLQSSGAIHGNDMLPLAPLVDQIAGSIGTAWRLEEQRHTEAMAPPRVAPEGGRRRARKHSDWGKSSERRWNEFLRRRGEEIGTLARLTISGADSVPVGLRRHADEMLQHLLRNALEHGIETPEERLSAEKPAAGQISVRFEDKGSAGLRIAIRDDGRGFNLERIGRAAVRCGLVSEESLLDRDAGDLVGLIFNPSFTTEGLSDDDYHGRGMAFLRRTVTRLGGQISVATKPGRYTQFTIQLPPDFAARDAEDAAQAASLDKA